ncbi:hypothetical protein [Candidatus Nitrosotenuis uzonensis]|uniref:Uncharacterized protein n=1 Tax=Candidatus Nitrosotenuis uzonensis TaxID=1407055 RepID=V6AUC1_9ARCH|nr:hypothetical protein [Candidatus Nitrosotenuis uzonensis]CDI06063.1 hypothetical protein NITUZ_40229 [Candidatus Nitrosotenuis uzonensis]
MNIYDTKIVRCSICDKCIGEISFDANIDSAKCVECNKPYTDNEKQQKTMTFFTFAS